MDTSILLVDDHIVFRMGLKLLLADEADIQVVGEADDGQTAIAQVEELSPNIVVMDIAMPNMDGIEATRYIKSEFPQTNIIALSIHGEKDFVEQMLQAGATGYVLKESAPEDLVPCIHTVRRGKVFLSGSIKDVVVSQYMEKLADTGPLTEGKTQGTLLTSKLYCPHVIQNTILRTRLIEQLEEGFNRPLTLVSAPAGYGKSTLVAQWLETCDYTSAWLSLDELDNDLRLFLTYLVAAVRTQFPEALQDSLRLAKASQLPPLPVLAQTLINDLDLLSQRFILVLDDYQCIEDLSIQTLLGELLQHPPRSLHLVLVSRTDPSLNLLQLRAYQQMGEVRTQGLSFTLEETLAYLVEVVGVAVEEWVAKEIMEKTEGWVTGLNLITLSVHDSAGLVSLSTVLPGEQSTLEYLATEALSRQPRDVQTWLLKTSILNRFCAPLCEAVSTLSDDEASNFTSDEFIHWLTETNLFVINLDHQGQWFRYHHLFRELLQDQLASALDAQDIADLHSRASRWFADNGLIEEAIKHALEAGDVIGAAKIVEKNRHAILDEDEFYTLNIWLSMLPDVVRQRRPELLIAEAWVHLAQDNLMAIFSNIERLEQIWGPDESDLPIWGEINYFKGYFCYFQGQGSQAYAHQRRALELIPEAHQHDRAEAELHYALTSHMIGRKENAILYLNQRLNASRTLPSIVSTRLWAGLCFIHLLEGDLLTAINPAEQSVIIASKAEDIYVEGFFLFLKACIHLIQNDREKAIQNFSWPVENRYNMQSRIPVDSLCGLVLLYHRTGQPKKVAETTRELVEVAQKTNDPTNILVAASCQARLSLMQGDVQAAVRWLRAADMSMDAGIMLWWIEIPRITACRVLIAEGSPDSLQEAIKKLQQYQKENQDVHNTYQVNVMLPLLALAYHKQGQDDKALAVLEEAITLAEPGGWIWPFVELGSPMADLLNRLHSQDVARDYVAQILAAFSEGRQEAGVQVVGAAGSTPHPFGVSLTKREQQVLSLLAAPLSPEEIASELTVSVATVRTHTKRIYSKLDVHTRMDAVSTARELDLL
ncbi:MAG: response regulator [Chloroflexota bacterium]|jgi:LuxR family maltose regulon positive regulatory protein